MRKSASTVGAAALALACLPAWATTVVDTGTPNGNVVGAYALDGTDFVAGQVSFAQAMNVQAIATHLLGVATGETFTLALYTDNAAHVPGMLLYAAQAIVTGAGWNGLTGLGGWAVSAGTYWIGIEANAGDTAGSGSVTGALLDAGAPTPLARTAFNAGAGYQLASPVQTFGLRLDAVAAVPDAATWQLLALGLASVAWVVGRRRC